ncbi:MULTISPECIES: DUF3810 domain-containing protein [Sporosarcina]|uniref:DUF3810 domain-containing protein n=1 Tax=Sporosarcina TaxID=1569 RepID=UPI000B241417|nr:MULTISPECIES: DUF3810 domain-containing protein [Sporosarcina]WJY28089.1 hypothetical protein QWT68_03655 [Sporosarcina sp. 0.2-SM1T-5]
MFLTLMSAVLAIALIVFGILFMTSKRKNRTTFILGFLYLLAGLIGIIVAFSFYW